MMSKLERLKLRLARWTADLFLLILLILFACMLARWCGESAEELTRKVGP